MLTGNEEKVPKNNKSAKGNAESDELPKYLRSTFATTYQQMEPAKIPKGKKVFPQFAYGNSIEAPSYFKGTNSILCRESYDNPYLKAKPKLNSKWDGLRSNTLNNYEFYNISDQRFTNLPTTGYRTNKMTNTITNQIAFVTTPQIKENDQNFESAYRTLQPNLFKKQRELFTDFVEKNDAQNVYGPLNMRTRPKDFREVKNFALNENQQKQLKLQRTMKITASPSPSNRTITQHFPKTQRLPQLDSEKYYKREQNYLNFLNNSIIRDSIDYKLKTNKSIIYNSDNCYKEYADNDMNLIEAFEKHLEFEKQFVS